jgi:hypothetical protein
LTQSHPNSGKKTENGRSMNMSMVEFKTKVLDTDQGIDKFVDYARTIGLIESEKGTNRLKVKLDKSIGIKTKIERLSDEEDRLDKTDFYAGVLYDYIGGLPTE